MAEEIDKYEDEIVEVGKEKGYLTFGEVNDLLPGDITSPDDLDDLLTTINTQGIELGGDEREGRGRDKYEPEAGEESEDVELDLSPGTLEKTNDPVRMYLREMGTVPLLTREGEVEIAKRIERGQLRVMKAISRSPIVIREIVGLGEDLRRGVRNIKEVVTFDEEELTEEILQSRVRQTVGRIDVILKHQKKITGFEEKCEQLDTKDAPDAKKGPRSRSCASIAGSWAASTSSSTASSASSNTPTPKRSGCSTKSTRPSTPCAPSSARSSPRRQVRRLQVRGAAQGIQAPAEKLPARSRARRA